MPPHLGGAVGRVKRQDPNACTSPTFIPGGARRARSAFLMSTLPAPSTHRWQEGATGPGGPATATRGCPPRPPASPSPLPLGGQASPPPPSKMRGGGPEGVDSVRSCWVWGPQSIPAATRGPPAPRPGQPRTQTGRKARVLGQPPATWPRGERERDPPDQNNYQCPRKKAATPPHRVLKGPPPGPNPLHTLPRPPPRPAWTRRCWESRPAGSEVRSGLRSRLPHALHIRVPPGMT